MSKINQTIPDYMGARGSLESAKAVWAGIGAVFRLTAFTAKERMEKKRAGKAAGCLLKGFPSLGVRNRAGRKRRPDFAGEPREKRRAIRRAGTGDRLCEYNDQGHDIKAAKLPEGGNACA